MDNKRYWIKDFNIKALVKKFGSPLIIYNHEIIKENFKAYRRAFPKTLIAYAIKANPINTILKILKEEGAGAETASYSEILLALKCGFPKEKIVFNGNAKLKEEIKLALSYNIKINFDSQEEIERVKLINQGRVPINSGIRINPFIEAGLMNITKTALRTSKFGISIEEAEKIIQEEKIKINTLHFHLGSQITTLSPFKKALKKILPLWDRLLLKGQPLKFLDIGGGLGIDYKKDENIPQINEYSKTINSLLKGRNIQLILEPGRSLVGNAGVIIAQIEYIKKIKNRLWIFLDVGADLLLRETYLGWYHEIIPLNHKDKKGEQKISYKIAGPLCFSGDIIAKNYLLAEVKEGEYLAILHSGAYVSSMMNNYCGRLNPAQIMLGGGGEIKLIRRRQKKEDLWQYDL